jgi:hypothetical protein
MGSVDGGQGKSHTREIGSRTVSVADPGSAELDIVATGGILSDEVSGNDFGVFRPGLKSWSSRLALMVASESGRIQSAPEDNIVD